jgi:hypothetical protein
VRVLVEFGADVALEQRIEVLGQRRAAHHPLEVVAVAVVVRAIEPRARDPFVEPADEPFVTHMHPHVTCGWRPSPPKCPSPRSTPTITPSSYGVRSTRPRR